MSLLIDGYNLLYAVGIVGRDTGGVGLQRSLTAMLNFLAETIDPNLLRRTTVVFDSVAPGFSLSGEYQGLAVRFAGYGRDADSLLEELILANTAPRRLVVVSSDHRLQRAAHRRRARAVDSDVWYRELIAAARARLQQAQQSSGRPIVPLLEEDVNYWVRQFGGEEFLKQCSCPEHEPAERPTASPPPATSEPPVSSEKPLDDIAGIENPFPPGYGEDLLRDEEGKEEG
jgi:hypothetical protein